MLSPTFRTYDFIVYDLLIVVVDRVSRLPRGSNLPEIMRLYREKLALKAQSGALLLEIDAAFHTLQEEMYEQIRARMGDTGRTLSQHSDEDVHRRLKAEAERHEIHSNCRN